MKDLAGLLTIVFLLGCGEIERPIGPGSAQASDARGGLLEPEARAAWDGLPARDRAAHARAVHIALETLGSGPVTWAGPRASGEITVEATSDLDEPVVCRRFHDRLILDGRPRDVRNYACWLGQWVYVRDLPPLVPVLAPAFAVSDRVYTVKRGGSLADVARVTGTDLQRLEILNPVLPDQLPPGTKVLLP